MPGPPGLWGSPVFVSYRFLSKAKRFWRFPHRTWWNMMPVAARPASLGRRSERLAPERLAPAPGPCCGLGPLSEGCRSAPWGGEGGSSD